MDVGRVLRDRHLPPPLRLQTSFMLARKSSREHLSLHRPCVNWQQAAGYPGRRRSIASGNRRWRCIKLQRSPKNRVLFIASCGSRRYCKLKPFLRDRSVQGEIHACTHGDSTGVLSLAAERFIDERPAAFAAPPAAGSASLTVLVHVHGTHFRRGEHQVGHAIAVDAACHDDPGRLTVRQRQGGHPTAPVVEHSVAHYDY
jgi:hypothetical protein